MKIKWTNNLKGELCYGIVIFVYANTLATF